MSSLIGEYSESHLLNVAKGVVEKKTKDSVLLDTNAEGRIPKFKLEGMKSYQNRHDCHICYNYSPLLALHFSID